MKHDVNTFQRLRWALPFIVGTLVLLILSLLLFWKVSFQNPQSVLSLTPDVVFEGEYRIGDGPWQTYVPGKHIPSTQGDVTLQGYFRFYIEDEFIDFPLNGTSICAFLDHIGATIMEPGQPPFVLDAEHPSLGHYFCSQFWLTHTFSSDGSQPITIVLHNPHRFGNALAVDTFFEHLSLYDSVIFERELESLDAPQRIAALIFILSACFTLGIAIFSFMLHVSISAFACLLSLTLFSVGAHFLFSATNIILWSDMYAFNTTVVVLSMFLYMLLILCLITYFMDGTARTVCRRTVLFMGTVCAGLLLIPTLTNIHFYDTLPIWVAAQGLSNLVVTICLVHGLVTKKPGWTFLCLFGLPVMTAFFLDVAAAAFGWWPSTQASRYVFILLYVMAFIMLLYIVPGNINSSIRSQELETEKKLLDAQLLESRTAIMISQIQPHFLYNTLGAIRELCRQAPEEARDALGDFASYLRGNMDSLTTTSLIPFRRELEHVQNYLKLEQMRFGENLNVEYDLQWQDFSLPPLTLQPIAENAVKHGLFHMENGGTLTISTRTDGNSSIITITDDGIGFDTDHPFNDADGRSHIGISNVSARLKSMANGTLHLDSAPGKGTTATITVPLTYSPEV